MLTSVFLRRGPPGSAHLSGNDRAVGEPGARKYPCGEGGRPLDRSPAQGSRFGDEPGGSPARWRRRKAPIGLKSPVTLGKPTLGYKTRRKKNNPITILSTRARLRFHLR